MKGKKILIADDSDLVMRLMERFLKEQDFDVIRAKNGVEAIELVYREIPDLIIMDVEMPLLQGYQASRLLKSKRGVMDIPIIMHTSLTEDKDEFWAISSGADAFVSKQFDNLTVILDKINELIRTEPLDEKAIMADGVNLNRDKIFELLSTCYEKELFQTTVLNVLGRVGRNIGSLKETVFGILDLLTKVCEPHVALILIKYDKKVMAFVQPSEKVYKKDVDDFMSFCLNDFYKHHPDLNLDSPEIHYPSLGVHKEFDKMRLDSKRLSSYNLHELMGNGGTVVGTLHIGNLTNNYFSDYLKENISAFAAGGGIILENSMLFTRVKTMERRIKSVFSKFVPPEIIDDLVEKEADSARMIGEKRKIVVLFSDIRAFTTISESNPPEIIVAFLNNFFDKMAGVIKKHGGIVDKFIGDAIFALFGAPKSYEDNSLRAVKAAMEMATLARDLEIEGLNTEGRGVHMGIGIHEGFAIIGNIGSSEKFDYTAIGDTVNLASRLESLTKYYWKPLLISGSVKEQMPPEIPLREVDTVKVKGKEQSTVLYAVEVEDSLDEESLSNHMKGIKLFKGGNWKTAMEYFRKVLDKNPGDRVSGLYLKRCHKFIADPPSDWDGTMALQQK